MILFLSASVFKFSHLEISAPHNNAMCLLPTQYRLFLKPTGVFLVEIPPTNGEQVSGLILVETPANLVAGISSTKSK